MVHVIKPRGDAITVTTANTVYDSPYVYVANGTQDSLITITTDGANTSVLLQAGIPIIIEKAGAATITAANAVTATPVAYR